MSRLEYYITKKKIRTEIRALPAYPPFKQMLEQLIG
jgi:hypothetical protein